MTESMPCAEEALQDGNARGQGCEVQGWAQSSNENTHALEQNNAKRAQC